MTNLNLPQRTFFDFIYACPYAAEPPKIDGNLREWDQHTLVPNLMGVEGQDAFADVHMSWNDSGLYFGIQVKNKTRYKLDPRKPTEGDCIELFIDARCERTPRESLLSPFYFYPPAWENGQNPLVSRWPSMRHASKPPCSEDTIEARLRVLKKSYQMEIKIPASGLNGFSPREFNRLGFSYLIRDTQLGIQTWSSTVDMGVDRDPSTWGSAELLDAS